jgi:phage FluMu protein Com
MAKTRKQKCDCLEKVYKNEFKKNSKDLSGLLGSVGSSLRIKLENAGLLAKSSNRLVTKRSMYDDGKCPRCNNTGFIEDKTDQSQQIQAASQKAQQLQKEITQLEADLGGAGPGGNRHTLVVGDDMLEVGLGYNDSSSYKVVENGSADPGGATITKKGVVRDIASTSAVIGTNPLATPGGHYVIKCSNKFTVRAGAQGIELNTEGPLIIRAGQTQLIGPEVTIGSAVGRVALEGKSMSIGGDYISINPGTGGKGQVSCTGTFTTAGNIIAQGGAHIEGDLSCISMTIPAKVTRSKHSSQDTQTTGAAVWQAEAASQGLQDFVRKITVQAGDAGALVLAPRVQQNIAADQKNLLKKGLPVEPQPTGYCTVLAGSSAGIHPIYNYPHHHTLSDGIHAHDQETGNFHLTNGCQAVRSTAKAKEAPAPVMANTSDPGSNLFTQAFQLIQSVVAKRVT